MPRYADLLPHYSAAALKSMASARGMGGGKMGKQAAINALTGALEDERSIRSVYEYLDAPARLLLALLRELGGAATVRQLHAAASRAGISDFNTPFRALIRTALILYAGPGPSQHELWNANTGAGSRWSYGSGRSTEALPIVGIPAALALADQPITLPSLEIAPYEGEPASVEEQPPSRLLQGLWTTVQWAEKRSVRVGKTTGTIMKQDQKALEKQVGGEEWATFLCAMALSAGIIVVIGDHVKVSTVARSFFQRPPAHQLQHLYQAWLNCVSWNEFFSIPGIESDPSAFTRTDSYSRYDDVPRPDDLVRARSFLHGLLTRAAAAPGGLGGWRSLAALGALVRTEDESFLIQHGRRDYYSYGSRDDYRGIYKAGVTRWSGGTLSKNTDWDIVEGGFIRAVFAGPLLWLGAVAVGCDATGVPVAFRLTPLGAHLLGLASAPLPDAPPADRKPLIVQPNFEVLAYMETEDLPVLFELERFAERMSADRVAHYRITRDSVYRGLQDGLTAAGIQEFLGRFSQTGVPQNVAYSLDDWQRLSERVQLRPDALLLETSSEAEMAEVLARLPEGVVTRLAPTWAVLDRARSAEVASALTEVSGAAAFDYSRAVAGVLSVASAGSSGEELRLEVQVPGKDLDLRLRARLEQFADAAGAEKDHALFRITPSTLERAAQLGIHHRDVMAFLESHGKPPLDADVLLTLRGWGGEIGAATLAEAVTLVLPEGILPQLAAIDELRELLWLKVSDRVALIHPEKAPAVREALARRGIKSGAAANYYLRPPARPTPPAVPKSPLPSTRRVAEAASLLAPAALGADGPTGADVPLERGLTSQKVDERLSGAIKGGRRVILDYDSQISGRQTRKVDPLALTRGSGPRNLYGYCHASEAIREFRVDRVRGIALLPEMIDLVPYEEAFTELMSALGVT